MAKLSLRITSDDLELLRLLQEELVLLWCALLSYRRHEHFVVHRQGRELARELDGIFKLRLRPVVFFGELLETLAPGQGRQDAVFATLKIILGLVEHRVRRQDFGEVFLLLQ